MTTDSLPPCPNCVKLEAELTTARNELANGVSVLTERERQSRAEVAELKRQRDDVWKFFEVTSEQELIDKLVALAAKP